MHAMIDQVKGGRKSILVACLVVRFILFDNYKSQLVIRVILA